MTTLSLAQLENHLWRAADILRGSIDSCDYKHYEHMLGWEKVEPLG